MPLLALATRADASLQKTLANPPTDKIDEMALQANKSRRSYGLQPSQLLGLAWAGVLQ